jgi:DNA-binding CsgD family transcriptional regulator
MGSNTIKKLFFEPIRREIVPKKQYKRFETLPLMCESLSRMTNKSAYVIDYSKQEFFFVSSHPLFLCGYTPQEVKEMGYAFYEKVLSPEDLRMLLEINKFDWSLFNIFPPSEISNVCFSYDFYLHYKNGTKTLVNHKLVPTFLTENNNMWLAMCTVELSSQKSSGNIVFTLNNRKEYYSYDFEKKQIIQYKSKGLTQQEENVLDLLMRGFDTEEIAKELKISLHTTQNPRRNITSKLLVSNITNAPAMFHSQF